MKNVKVITTILLILFLVNAFGCARGKQGVSGSTGKPGTYCGVTSVAGGTLFTCTDGTSQFVANPTNGTDGHDGHDGNDGQDGSDASIGIVSLCSAVTQYPIVFTEVAFCIGNNLYAVYSENDGFLTYVPPGNYSSHGHNSSCSFTVQSNCVVSH